MGDLFGLQDLQANLVPKVLKKLLNPDSGRKKLGQPWASRPGEYQAPSNMSKAVLIWTIHREIHQHPLFLPLLMHFSISKLLLNRLSVCYTRP